MHVSALLPKVKTMLGITGSYQDELLTEYIEEVIAFMVDAGVPKDTKANVTGVVARGVSDLWNYGMGNASFSPYFMQRVAQLSYEKEAKDE